jgi:hypothetical protein
MDRHHHKPARRCGAEVFRTSGCAPIQIDECERGAFRLPGMERWVEPASLPEPTDFTITSAARYRRISVRTMERLLA